MKRIAVFFISVFICSLFLPIFEDNYSLEKSEKHNFSSSNSSNLTIYTGELSIEKIDFNRSTTSLKIEESLSGGYFLLSGYFGSSTQTSADCYKAVKDPIVSYLDNNFNLIWHIDLIGWCLVDFEAFESNITFILNEMHLTNHLELLYNPFGNDAINDAMRIISVSSQNTTRYFTSLDLSTDLKGLENNDLYPDVYYSLTQDGGFMIGGTTKDKIVINGTTEGTANSRRDDRYMSAPPFYECLGSYKVDTPWFTKYDHLGNQQIFLMAQGNAVGQKFAGFSQNVENGTYNVFLVSNQANGNCNGGSSTWTVNQSTYSSNSESVIKLNSKGEVYDISDAEFDFSMVENLFAFGPEYNGTQVALWHSTTTWNSTTQITSAYSGAFGISFVRNGDLIHRGFENNGSSSLTPTVYGYNRMPPQLIRIQTEQARLFVPFLGSGSINGYYYQTNTYFLGEYDYNGNLSPPTSHVRTNGVPMIGSYDTLITQNTTLRTTNSAYDGYHLQAYPIGPQNPLYQPAIFVFSHDNDGDLMSDSIDPFPNEPTQWSDSDGDGFGDNPNGFEADDCTEINGTSWRDLFGCQDDDGDGQSNTNDAFANIASQWLDFDSDGFGDNASGFQGDSCITEYGESRRGTVFGCVDTDYDGWADVIDDFSNDSSQWLDSDGDGYGDELNGNNGDSCKFTPGNSTLDRYGCIDEDGDGYSNKNDDLPQNPTQNSDRDGDGYGDNSSENATMRDAFPNDGTQWSDSDNDGHGDNPYGTLGDWFPNDPTRWQDSDRDGVADEDDAFPNERSQSEDLDGDGYGDNPEGENSDAFPSNPDEWQDTDGDFVGNNEDAFPFDPSQTTDTDGDGFGDNPVGNGADRFPGDPSQWMDIDGDGYGDNQSGTFPDIFITDPTQWSDMDGDGFGDNPGGRQADAFPNDPTQWEDLDGDGLGDSEIGNNPDPFLFDFDNDGYNDSIDPLPKLASPGDLDNDGILDEEDMFPEDFREWADNDGDGVGDNADNDDDNDGWLDADELREGTDPFSSSEQPVDSFEIVIPGTAVGLGAWDLIGIFGGVPLFIWIGFGFITRNGRTAKYEEKLRAANTRDELENVARQWEYSLMLRMLGPHQGIRLERLRAELDDVFERQNQTLSSLEQSEYNQTQLVQDEMNQSEKQVPEINLKPDIDAVGNPDEKGYEWITSEDGKNWYRTQGTRDDWVEFSS